MAVVAVIITAPLGAILTNTLGLIWLEDDSNTMKSTDTGVQMSRSFLSMNKSADLRKSGLMKSDIAPKDFKYNVPGEKKPKKVMNYLTGKYELVEEEIEVESPSSPD